ncbi:MAG: ABC transporter permease [Bacteroidaceae bacterium]|nr:ABC transporter permease [Bacteroidaceae bacterium]
MNFSYFIAKRFYQDNDGKKRFSRPAITIAMLGIAIGLAVMIISVSVVKGFQKEVSSKVIGFGNDMQVFNLSYMDEYENSPILLTDSFLNVVKRVDGLKHIQRFSSKTAMLKTDEDFLGVNLKGVGEEYDLSFIKSYIVEGEIPQFSDTVASNSIVLSTSQANKLGLKVGDKIYTYFITSDNIRARRLTLAATYCTNLTEYDKTYAFTDIYTINRLNKWTNEMATGLEIQVNDFERLEAVTADMMSVVGQKLDANGCIYGAFSIKDLAPGTFSWLEVLDMNVVMILVLMICVASFTVVSGLLIIMLERIHVIGTLKALGTSDFQIRKIFFYFALMLVGKGMVIGNVVGLLSCFLQKQFHFVKLDSETYYIDAVPIEFNWWYIIGVNILTLVVSAIVIFGGSHLISVGKPTNAMRFE